MRPPRPFTASESSALLARAKTQSLGEVNLASLSPRFEPLPFDPLYPTIFHERWWLDAATAGQCQEVAVSSGPKLIGRLPFWIQHRGFGFHLNKLPTLTHVLGPAIDEGTGAAATRVLRRYETTRELIAKLPRAASFRQTMHRGVSDTLAFQSAGFRAAVQFTFEVAPKPAEELWLELRNKTRNVIRRAGERFAVSHLADCDEFLAFYYGNLETRRIRTVIDPVISRVLCAAALARQRGHILCARDPHGSLVAAIFLVWDSKSVYYLMSTRNENSGNGAVSLLLWNAIQSAAAHRLTFDFDGVSKEGAVLLYSGFGGRPQPRFLISKDGLSYRLAAKLWHRALGPGGSSSFDRY